MGTKISFLGDIMCERPFLKAARRGRAYDFSNFLLPCKELFRQSEYVIGNLETPCDPQSEPTKDMFIFNAPISFAEAIKESGINFVTTASNHCLDRGLSGLKNTIKSLDEIGLSHTGTFLREDDDKFARLKLSDGTVLSILSYTYGTNYMDNKVLIEESDHYTVNHLTPLYSGRNKAYEGMNNSVRAKITRLIPRDFRIRVNTMMGRSSNLAFTDRLQDGDLLEEKQKEIADNIRIAKKSSDITIICSHFGGQFNLQPGAYVDAFVDLFERSGANAVIGNHPHVVQRFEERASGMMVAYSLGNVSMSLSTPYVIKKDFPECSIMLHFYIENGEIVKTTFSILVEIENNGFITVHPLYDLYEKSDREGQEKLFNKCRIIYNRFTNRPDGDIQVLPEYLI